MRRFGKHARQVTRPRWLAAGAVAACLLGLSTVALTNASAGTGPAPMMGTPGTVAPDSAAVGSAAQAARTTGIPAGEEGCPAGPSLLDMRCQSLIDHNKKSAGTLLRPRSAAVKTATTDITTSLGPAELQTAYGLTSASANDKTDQTVAIVDAYGDPHITNDLATYRSNWTLPACDTATEQGCLTVLNQNGQPGPLPPAGTGLNLSWEDETALDVEMVSAICPYCHIVLFQANSANLDDLGTAENSAAKVSKFISNSWSESGSYPSDFPGEAVYDAAYFNHPGVVMDFAAGDYGFAPTYPGSSGLVTSVGGTYMNSDGSQVVWTGQSTGPGTGTAAGCSAGEAKPSWQTDTGCTNRTQNDVSAVADAPAGIDEYTSSGDCGPDLDSGGAFNEPNDCAIYGTSVATPIITAIYALANPDGPVLNTYPASYLYQHAGDSSDLTPVTSGRIGTCESSRQYLCNAADRLANGYNGPTGLGTPVGLGAFQNSDSGDIVSIVNPGTWDLTAGSRVTLPAIKAYDSVSGHALTYSATGLPSGVSINSATGVISGTLPANPVNDTVTVKVTDGSGGVAASPSIRFGFVGVKAMYSAYHGGSGKIDLIHVHNTCLNDPNNNTHVDAPVSTYPCQVSSSQDWSYRMPGGPGQNGQLSIHGKCVSVLGGVNRYGYHVVGLVNCSGSVNDEWALTGFDGEIINPAHDYCLTDPNSTSTANTQFDVQPCSGIAGQTLIMPASPITSGIAGKCLANDSGTAVTTSCTGAAAQQVILAPNGSIQFSGRCIYNAAGDPNDGTGIHLLPCGPSAGMLWGISAFGEIENLSTNKCLAVTGNSTANGAKIELNDCTGQPGELWAAS